MARSYIVHNEIFRYWKIECISKEYPNASGNFVFKGKTLEGAIKSAQRYCDKFCFQMKKYGFQMKIGKILYECDYYGRKVKDFLN